jgi:hypothetical protein
MTGGAEADRPSPSFDRGFLLPGIVRIEQFDGGGGFFRVLAEIL